jgi:hypothetical protein
MELQEGWRNSLQEDMTEELGEQELHFILSQKQFL